MTVNFNGVNYTIEIIKHNYLDNKHLVLVKLLEMGCEMIVDTWDIRYA